MATTPMIFSSTAAQWSARPSDPNDVFVAQVIATRDEPAKVGLFGVPFDGAVLGRPGAREGPDAIRAQMAKLKPWTLAHGAVPLAVRDWGNVRVDIGPQDDVETTRPAGRVGIPMDVAGAAEPRLGLSATAVADAHEATETAALAVLDAGQIPVALGGDHSLTFPLVKAHEGSRQRIGVINLDAHLDVRDHKGTPNSGTSFARLLALGLVPGENLVELGLRDFANASAYADKARKAGATLFGADEWMRDGLAVVDHAIEIASRNVDGVYLSIDIDVLDQAHAPGVSAPTPGGVDTRTLFAAIRRIAERAPLVGADLVELAPPLDRDHMTARASAYAIMHLLAGLAAR